MEKPIVIFGTTDAAELANFYFESDGNRSVVAFTVDESFREAKSVFGKPIVAFEQLEKFYPPNQYELFIAAGYSGLNKLRKNKFLEAKAKGYKLASYVSSRATILNEGRIGENCFLLEDNTVQPFVSIGDNVVLWSGNHIGHHSRIGDHTFIASHVVVSGRVSIGRECFIGVNATIRDSIEIGDCCIIGAATTILSNCENAGVYKAEGTTRSRIPSSKLARI